ncbi:MAG: DNA gyrase/topoisomerase IV subunit A, partial [Chitinophagia bacterium]|nr:DNA gyrase/topoisomerase IV subunit A [Chitinophagia bacterium]
TPITFISDSDGSKLYYASLSEEPKLKYSYKANNKKVEHVMDVNDFIDVKGYKALGNKLGEFKVLKIEELETQKKTSSDNENGKSDEKEQGDLSPGDTIEFDF